MRRLSAALTLVFLLGAPSWALKTEVIKAKTVSPSLLSGFSGASAAAAANDREVVSQTAFVKFKVGTSSAARDASLATIGVSYGMVLGETGWDTVVWDDNRAVAQMLSQLSALSTVEAVSPNHAYRLNVVPSDPLAQSEYHLSLLNAFAGWEYETGSSSETTVAVVDAGIDVSHPDLSARTASMPHQFCDPGNCKSTATCADPSLDSLACAADGATPPVACNHGTRVAGLAAATGNNGIQSAGLNWSSHLLAMRIFRTGDCNADCSGNCVTDDQSIINALSYLETINDTAGVGKLIANLSLGAQVSPCPTALNNAITSAVNDGIVVVASAGNYAGSSNGGPVQSPGNCSNVITVGATDANDDIAGFSARGSEMSAHGVVAPGVAVPTTDLGGGRTTASGTSFSAPIVSGIAALILSKKPTATVNGTTNEVLNILRGSAQGIGLASLSVSSLSPQSDTVGAGRVSAFRAMKLTVDGTLAGFAGDAKAIAFPNPFRPGSHGLVTITIPTGIQGRNASVKIYTIDGQLVRDLGASTTWDGKNDAGRSVATGTYIFLVKTDSGDQTGRVAVIR